MSDIDVCQNTNTEPSFLGDPLDLRPGSVKLIRNLLYDPSNTTFRRTWENRSGESDEARVDIEGGEDISQDENI